MTKTPKTPKYTLKAVSKYDKKVKKPQVVLNPELPDEQAIIEAIKDDELSFSERCKFLLKKYYEIT